MHFPLTLVEVVDYEIDWDAKRSRTEENVGTEAYLIGDKESFQKDSWRGRRCSVQSRIRVNT